MSTRRKQPGKQILTWISLGIGLVLVYNLSRGILDLLNARERVVESQTEVDNLLSRKTELEKQYFNQSSSAFVEQEIREKLRLSKPGETVVLIDGDLPPASGSALISLTQKKPDPPPIWCRWLNLLLYPESPRS